jgi:ABC-2 type transport system ATP-binding protein
MSRTPVLQFTQVAYGYQPSREALSDVTFSLAPEEVVALLGRNGSGKTTLIQLAMGMLFPQRGTIRAFGLDPRRDPIETKRRIGYVAEEQPFPLGMSVGELLAFHRRLFPSWDIVLERELLDRFALPDRRPKIGTLSRGQARQLALICAICHRPQLLILDEPASGLDPAARREILTTSMLLLNREGTAILHSSHYLSEVERLGGRALVLDEGRVVLDESFDDLREEHCVAVIEHRAGWTTEKIAGIPGCVRVRSTAGYWRAVFRGSPARTRQRITLEVGVTDVTCTRASLEELFIDILGGARHAVAADEAILPIPARRAGVR